MGILKRQIEEMHDTEVSTVYPIQCLSEQISDLDTGLNDWKPFEFFIEHRHSGFIRKLKPCSTIESTIGTTITTRTIDEPNASTCT